MGSSSWPRTPAATQPHRYSQARPSGLSSRDLPSCRSRLYPPEAQTPVSSREGLPWESLPCPHPPWPQVRERDRDSLLSGRTRAWPSGWSDGGAPWHSRPAAVFALKETRVQPLPPGSAQPRMWCLATVARCVDCPTEGAEQPHTYLRATRAWLAFVSLESNHRLG